MRFFFPSARFDSYAKIIFITRMRMISLPARRALLSVDDLNLPISSARPVFGLFNISKLRVRIDWIFTAPSERKSNRGREGTERIMLFFALESSVSHERRATENTLRAHIGPTHGTSLPLTRPTAINIASHEWFGIIFMSEKSLISYFASHFTAGNRTFGNFPHRPTKSENSFRIPSFYSISLYSAATY